MKIFCLSGMYEAICYREVHQDFGMLLQGWKFVFVHTARSVGSSSTMQEVGCENVASVSRAPYIAAYTTLGQERPMLTLITDSLPEMLYSMKKLLNSVEELSLFQITLLEMILRPDSSSISRDACASSMRHAERLLTQVFSSGGKGEGRTQSLLTSVV